MKILNQMENQGVNISLQGDKLRLQPVENITPEIIALVKTNKSKILQEISNRSPRLKIKKMSTCLARVKCRFVSVVDDRQFCSKYKQYIFDMDKCPGGRWCR